MSESSRYVDGLNFAPTVDCIQKHMPPIVFVQFGYVSNACVGLGYWPECIPLVSNKSRGEVPGRVRNAYQLAHAIHTLY